jgi:hypothetical protein
MTERKALFFWSNPEHQYNRIVAANRFNAMPYIDNINAVWWFTPFLAYT